MSVLVDVDPLRCRALRQTRHGHYISGKHYYKACTRRYAHILDGNAKVLRSTELFRIIGKAVLRFCYAYRQSAEAELFEPRYLL